MAVTPFVRNPNLSSTLVLQRMRVKRGVYQRRREAIQRESEDLARRLTSSAERSREDLQARLRSLDLEDRRIVGFQADLEALVRAEDAGIERRLGRTTPSTPEAEHPQIAASDGSQSAAPVAAGAGAAVSRYDEGLCLFKAFEAPVAGDPSARPIGDVAGGDVLLAGLIGLVDVPGLAHFALLTERRQEVCEISTNGVPPEALGLPAAEAFAGHVFSADAYEALSDEAAAAHFMTVIARLSSKRST